MSKLFIKNRKGQKVSVLVEGEGNKKGLAFIMHGLGGFKEYVANQVVAEAFLEHGYVVVRFDTTNTLGESDGKYEDATTTNYYEDLEDVITWTKTQSWYHEPFVLSGFSLGGLCIALYAERYPEQVKGLIPIGSVISGKLSFDSPRWQKFLLEWKRTGWREEKSISKPGVLKRLKYSHVQDRLKYDLLPQARKLTMPTLLIFGENDESCPLNQREILYNALPGPKKLHIIKGAPHVFRESEHLEEMRGIIMRWIVRLK